MYWQSILRLFALVLACLATGTTFAANITTFEFGTAGESPGEGVLIKGELYYADIAAFQDIAARLPRQTVVIISSPGGNLKAGIEIGRTIHKKGFRTAVADVCASACALAWLAGSQRFASERALIGFHVAYVDGVQKVESGMGNAIVGLYLGELGFRENVVAYITSASPDEMQWLSFRDAALLGIDVEMFESPSTSTEASPLPEQRTAQTKYINPEDAAVALIRELVTSDMTRGRDALTMVRNTYADWVNYYGKKSSFSSVYADKQRYFERWPKRNYRIREDTLRVSCDGTYCMVSGVLDWQVSSPVRKKNASGVAYFEYLLERVAGNLRVVSEDGKVLR